MPHALGNGALVFLPLGAANMHIGISAGLSGAFVGAFISASFGRPRYQVLGCSTTISVILATLVTTLAANPVFQGADVIRAGQIAAIVFTTVFLGGSLQLVLAWLCLGRALKFIPQPVLAGFMAGMALQLFLQQLKPLLGLGAAVPLLSLPLHVQEIQPSSVAVGVVTILTALWVEKRSPRLPGTMLAMVAGMATFTLAGRQGDVLGGYVGGFAPNSLLPALDSFEWVTIWREVWVDVFATAFLIAIVGSVMTLLSAAVLDAATGSNQDGDRTLFIQGVSNICSAAVGGIFVGGAHIVSLANYQHGGRTALSGIVLALICLAVMLGAGAIFEFVPLAALAGVMSVVAFGLIQELRRDLRFSSRRGGRFDANNIANFAIVVLVGATTAFINVLAAAIIGVIAASILLITRISTSNIHRLTDAKTLSSIKVRPAGQTRVLLEHGASIGVVELSGYVFFGTVAAMRAEIEAFAANHKVIILDFRRAYEIEFSGVREILALTRSVENRDIIVAFSHLRINLSAALLLDDGRRRSLLFEDLDAALEWAEEKVLTSAGKHIDSSIEIPLGAAELFARFDQTEINSLLGMLKREELTAGSVIFREGDAGDRLFIITRGEVSINLRLPGTSRIKRLATFGPGMVFGEMALLGGGPRSADATVISDAVVFSLDAPVFSTLQKDEGMLVSKLMQGFARQLAARLRSTSDRLRGSI